MVLEIAQIEIRPGSAVPFEAAVCQAAPKIAASKGCRGITLHRSVENPDRYRLLVRWETVENHVIDFVASEAMSIVGALMVPFFAGEPSVEHLREVDLGGAGVVK